MNKHLTAEQVHVDKNSNSKYQSIGYLQKHVELNVFIYPDRAWVETKA